MCSSLYFWRHQHAGNAETEAFPTRQLFILALCRICEPIAFMSIFPYVYYMVLSFDITSDTRMLAVYVGLVTSSFAFAEFSSGVTWGRISDKVGRKPVLLCGLAGTALSMLLFGFAPSLPVALLARALGGLLNGNMGVLQTTIAEIVKVKKHQPRAYSIMPFVWCLGSILGPAMGGALARPCESYPAIFPQGTIFDSFPYLLPNLICAMILACGVVVGILFLEETHEEKKNRKDWGVEAGSWLLAHFKSKDSRTPTAETTQIAPPAFGDDDEPPAYRTADGTPRQSLSRSRPTSVSADDLNAKLLSSNLKPRGVKKAFTKQVILNIIGFGILAYHSISFDQLMPVFLSEPVSHEPATLPFRFTGGFGLSSKSIGFMLSVQGVYSMIAQLVIFPLVARRFGTLKTFRFVVMTWPVLYALVPYTVLLPQCLQKMGVYVCLLWKITFHVLAFPSNAILLTNAAPSTLVLGVINGVAASTASLARACGPTVTGIVHAWGLEFGSAGLAWWVSGIVCAIGAIESLWLEEVTNGRMDQQEDGDTEDNAALLSKESSEVDLTALPNHLPKVDSKIRVDDLGK